MARMSKKIIAVFLVLILTAVFVAPTAFAKGHNNNSMNRFLNGNAFQKGRLSFQDVDEKLEWARLAIEKMFAKGVIKGYNNNLFKPNNNVTHLEAIIMAIRIMGWEDEAKSIRDLPTNIRSLNLSWADAYYYIALATQKGIIKPQEVKGFNPNTPAKRYEVAKYIVRALNKEDEAKDHMRDKLPFKDANAIPRDAVGYVYVMVDLGLMRGDDKGLFQPNKPISRAEMAVLIERIDGVTSPESKDELVGIIYDIDYEDLYIEIKNSIGTKAYDVEKDVPVYYNGKYLDFEDLIKGDKVELTLNSKRDVVFIQLLEESDREKVTISAKGLVTDVNLRAKTISLHTVITAEGQGFIGTLKENNIGGKHYELETGQGRFVLLGNTKDLKDHVGDVIIVKGEIKDVFSIYMRGEIIDVEGFYPVKNRDVVTFEVKRDTYILLDGKRAALDHIKVGDFAGIEAEGDTALEINAESLKEYLEERDWEQEEQVKHDTIEGKVVRINDDLTKLRIETKDGYYNFAIAKKVDLDDDLENLKDLVGKQVILEIENDVVVVIDLVDDSYEIEGKVVRINDDLTKLRIETKDGYYNFAIAKKVDLDAHIDDLEDIIGKQVVLKIRDGQVVKIDLANIDRDRIIGEVVNVSENQPKFRIKTDDGFYTFTVDDDVDFDKGIDELEDIAGKRVAVELEDGKVVKIKLLN